MRLAAIALMLTLAASPAKREPTPTCVSGICFSQLKWVGAGGNDPGNCCWVEGIIQNDTATRLLVVTLEFEAYAGKVRVGKAIGENAVLSTYSAWTFRVPVPSLGEQRAITGMQAARLSWFESNGRQQLDLGAVPRVCNPAVKEC
jgi:hypothetical protein